jgi:hypothetical protein
MPLVLQVPCGDANHRIVVSNTTAKRLATLPKEQHASFTEGLLRMIRTSTAEAPKPLPKASSKIRKPKPQAKKREVTEAIRDAPST